jgi:hypothetical protein
VRADAEIDVWADALLEAGDPQGEHLALVRRAEALPPLDPRAEEMVRRAESLWETGHRRWIERAAPLAASDPRVRWWRGLPSVFHVESPGDVDDALRSDAPIAALEVALGPGGAELVERIEASELLEQLSGLAILGRTEAPWAALARLARSPRLGSLRSLELPVDPEIASSIAGNSALGALRELHLRLAPGAHPLAIAGIERLSRAAHLAGLRTLGLGGGILGEPGVAALGEAVFSLWSLELDGATLGNDGPKGFSRPSFAELRVLRLARPEIRSRGWPVLATAALPELRRLAIERCGTELGARNLPFLLDSLALPSLVSLGLAAGALKQAGASAIARCTRLEGLEQLDLADNALGDAGVFELARARLPALRELDLANNGIHGAPSLGALASSPLAPGLEVLALAGNRFKTEGARSLAGSRRWTRLRRLDLSGTGTGVGGVRAILDNPAIAATIESLPGADDGALQAILRNEQLHLVELSAVAARPEDVRALADRENARSLRRIAVPGPAFDAETAAAWAASQHFESLGRLVIAGPIDPEARGTLARKFGGSVVSAED